MTDEPTVEDETKPAPKGLPTDEKWDRVEMDEETQKRFNRLYGEMKRGNAKVEEATRRMNTMATDQVMLVERIEGLTAQTEDRNVKIDVDSLMAKQKEAVENGDVEAVQEITTQIAELRKPAPVERSKPEPTDDQPVLSKTEEVRLIQWAQETNGDGDLIRPWADAGHPSHKKAMKMAEAALIDVDDIDTALAEVDRLMDVPTVTRKAAPVLSGNDDLPAPKEKGAKLSQDQRAISHAMFDKLTPAEAEKKYAKALEAV